MKALLQKSMSWPPVRAKRPSHLYIVFGTFRSVPATPFFPGENTASHRNNGFEYYEELPIGTYTLSTTNNCNLRIYESDDSSFPTQTVSFQRNDKNRIIFTTTKPYVTFKTFNSSLTAILNA